MSYPGDQPGQQPAYPSYPDPNQGGFQPPQQPGPYGQPQSAPPAQGQPFPPAQAQPYSSPPAQAQPYSSPPAQAQPYSSPPAGQPYSSPPAPAGYGPEQTAPYSGAGYGYDSNAGSFGTPPTGGPGPAQPTGQSKSKLVPLFASLMVVFLLATAVLSVLYVTKNGDYNDTKKAAQTKETQLSGDLKKSQDDLKKAQDDLASAKRDLGGSQAQADELARQKSVISKCFKLLIEASQAISAGNQALADQKRAEYTPVCNEADKYLD